MTLDDLRAFLRSDDEFPNVVHRSRYSEFMNSKGYGDAVYEPTVLRPHRFRA